MLSFSSKTKSVNLIDVRSGKKLVELFSGEFPWLHCTNEYFCVAVQQLVTVWKNLVGMKGVNMQQPYFKLKHGFSSVKIIIFESAANEIHLVLIFLNFFSLF
jgi:hypothetical protein